MSPENDVIQIIIRGWDNLQTALYGRRHSVLSWDFIGMCGAW